MFVWPATPTPMPPGGPPKFDVPISLWDAAPHMIQWWNWIGAVGMVIQLVLLVTCLIVGIAIVRKFILNFTKQDAEG